MNIIFQKFFGMTESEIEWLSVDVPDCKIINIYKLTPSCTSALGFTVFFSNVYML